MQLLVAYVTDSVYSIIYGVDALYPDQWNNALLLISALLSLLVVWFFAHRHKVSFGKYTGINRSVRPSSAIFFCLLLGASACTWSTFVLNMLPVSAKLMEQYDESYIFMSAGPLPLELLLTILIAPILEEILFRGLIFHRLRIAFPLGVANLVQAILFGSLHTGTVWMVYATIFGCVLGYVRITADSLRASVFTHIAFNSMSYLLSVTIANRDLNQFVFYGIFLLSAGLFIISATKIRPRQPVGQGGANG